MTRHASPVLVLLALAAALGGCAMGAVGPTYTPEELKARCERDGGWWQANPQGGFCDIQGAGMV